MAKISFKHGEEKKRNDKMSPKGSIKPLENRKTKKITKKPRDPQGKIT